MLQQAAIRTEVVAEASDVTALPGNLWRTFVLRLNATEQQISVLRRASPGRAPDGLLLALCQAISARIIEATRWPERIASSIIASLGL
jgi:hypothetical protein